MKKELLAILLTFFLFACGGKKNAPAPVVPPGKALLTSPLQNAVCTTGTVISAGQSSILFTWDASANTDNYDLVIKNLLTSISTTQSTAASSLTVTLDRNTPYSWYVVSRSEKTSTTAQSDTWKFYNSGPGAVSYPPYPADIKSPSYGQVITAASGTVGLSWTGSTPDNGPIAGYDVYFGTTSSPALLKSGITDDFVNGVAITSGLTYYWKVVSRDNLGNTSDSGLYQFTAN